MRTSPASVQWLMTRTNPCRPRASDAAGRYCTKWALPASFPGAVDRLVRYPAGSDSRLITTSGCADSTVSRHLPSPSPSAPWSPSPPDSSAAAVNVRDAPEAMVVVTSLPGDSPRSSTPTMETSAASSPGFTRRSRLTWLSLLPGLKKTTRCLPPSLGTVSCIAVRNPSVSGHPQGRSAAKEPRSGLTRLNPLTLDPTCCGFSHSLFAIYVRIYAAVNRSATN